MSANREIPGYYFDPEKKRYFKIENSKTAPSEAPWSAENVKRRKIADREAARARERLERSKCRVKQSRVLAEPLMGGFLRRETGRLSPEVPVASFARGLREKGSVPLFPPEMPSPVNIAHLYVGNHDCNLGFGVVYGTLDEESLVGCYIPRDNNDRIDEDIVNKYRLDSRMPREEIIMCPQMSSLKYHEPSHRILLTSRKPGPRVGVSFFSPQVSYGRDTEPEWLIGGADHYENFSRFSPSPDCVANTCTPAPASSDLICLIGTSDGILQFRREGPLTWLTPGGGAAPPSHATGAAAAGPRDVFSIDFLAGNPNVVFAGGRSSRLSMADLRTAPRSWEELAIRHASSVAHVRSLNEHQVLAAGPRSAMCVYDIRFRKEAAAAARPNDGGGGRRRAGRGGGAGKGAHRPLLTFPGFRNGAHIHFGLDVEPAMGVVAAAHDNGGVGVYSLRSGRRLACPPVDKVAIRGGVVKGVMFQTLPRDRLPSLFLGEGANVCKYSFGVLDGADEILEE